jgi:hypothetical protein
MILEQLAMLLAGRVSQRISQVGFPLPEESHLWREGCFRATGTLLNYAAEYETPKQSSSTNPSVIAIVLQSWGSNRRLIVVVSSLLEYSILPTTSSGLLGMHTSHYMHC